MRAGPQVQPSIYVLAGTNGAGKSSVAGAAFRDHGTDYFNPDEATRRILEANPDIGLDEANSEAWLQGKRLLEKSITERLEFAFETTLGGNTIPGLLADAHDAGLAVRVWYVGLEGPNSTSPGCGRGWRKQDTTSPKLPSTSATIAAAKI